MKLKQIDFNGEIVLGSKLNQREYFFGKIVKIAFKNESYKLFFQKDAIVPQKTRLSITFS